MKLYLSGGMTGLPDLKALLDCDAIALIDGWQESAGAHLEMHVAHRVGMRIVLAKEIDSPNPLKAY